MMFIPSTDKKQTSMESASMVRRTMLTSVVANLRSATHITKNTSQSVGSGRTFHTNPQRLQRPHWGKLFSGGLPSSPRPQAWHQFNQKPHSWFRWNQECNFYLTKVLWSSLERCTPGKSWLLTCVPVIQLGSPAEDRPPCKRTRCIPVSL